MKEKFESSLSEKIILYRLADLPYIELFRGYNIKRSFSRHVHFVFSLGVILKGERHLTFGGKNFQAKPGDIILVNPGDTHDNSVNNGCCSSLAIRLDAKEFQRLVNRFYGNEVCNFRFRQPVVKDEELWQRVIQLHEMLNRYESLSKKQNLLADTLFTLFARHAITKPAGFESLERPVALEIRDYLSENYAENISLDKLGRIINLSPFQLVRAFGNRFGVPPHTYLTQVRLNQALKLLSQGNSLADTAQETGFYDQSHFCKAFKNKFGLTPGEYRFSSFNACVIN